MLSPGKLKFLRVLHNLTQTEVAKKLGVTKNYISEVENGKAQYSEIQQNKIVTAIYVAHGEKNKEESVKEILEDLGNVIIDMSK